MHVDRQISVRRVTDDSTISKTSLYEIMIDDLGTKKSYTRWVSQLFTSLQRANRGDCCEELLENCNQDLTGLFGRLVTRNETWIHYYDPLNQQEAKTLKKLGEKTPIRHTSYTIGWQVRHDHLLGL